MKAWLLTWEGTSGPALVPDQKIIAAGAFSKIGNTTAGRIVRLQPDGSLDASFNTGAGFNSSVYTVVRMADGRFLVGGSFSQFKMPGYEVCVQMGLDDVFDLGAVLGGRFEINIDVTLRVDHSGIAAGHDHVRCVRKTTQIEVFDYRRFHLWRV